MHLTRIIRIDTSLQVLRNREYGVHFDCGVVASAWLLQINEAISSDFFPFSSYFLPISFHGSPFSFHFLPLIYRPVSQNIHLWGVVYWQGVAPKRLIEFEYILTRFTPENDRSRRAFLKFDIFTQIAWKTIDFGAFFLVGRSGRVGPGLAGSVRVNHSTFIFSTGILIFLYDLKCHFYNTPILE